MNRASETATVVVNGHVFEVLTDKAGAPMSMKVTIRAEGDQTWTFEEPGWQALGYGLYDDGFYLWSARRVILCPCARATEPELSSVDEDIVIPFRLGPNWVMVCETSVRVVSSAGELARAEFGDVIASAHIHGQDIALRLHHNGAMSVRVEMDPPGLKVLGVASET